MATIKDVARMAGVSVSTVSKYINGGNVRPENVEPIRSAIEKLEFRVNPFARSLKTQRSRSIGVLLPDITAPFFGNVLTALDKVLRENGYHSLISCYSSNHGLERDNLSFLLSAGIDGLIYAPEDLSVEEFYELTANRKIPVVQLDRTLQGLSADAVLVNNADASYSAVCHLIDKGHRRVAIISGPKSVFSAKERQIGYLRALSDRGILYDDQLVISDQNDFATGHRGFDALMKLEDKPTAVFTTNHNITMGFLTAAHEQGLRIPEDIDIFGFDCVDICSMMRPPLPVVHQPEVEIGTLAASYLIQRLDGYTGEPRVTKLKCKHNI
jgi:LacI family transcriptional regulator